MTNEKLAAIAATTQPKATSLATDIAAHCLAFEQSPEYSTMLQKHVSSLYEKTIRETFEWGDFPRAVKKALEEALPANISEMVNLRRYNILMAKKLEESWTLNAVGERMTGSMQKMVLDFVKSEETPKYIKASDLWKAYIEEHKEEAAHEGWERPEVLMEMGEGDVFRVGIEKEPASESSSLYSSSRNNKKTHAFEFTDNFYFMRKGEYVDSKGRMDKIMQEVDGFPVYELYSGQVDGDALGKKVIMFRGEFEKLVGALYYGDSLLVLDESDADEVYYPDCY
ncbi:Uncharacterised protein [Yersinia similis]|uniref:Uncharacterized protein n=1 Tax=Yersinia similis TaxID=367190 RepID=A0A0T9PTC1_9GAMM|nr:hypothetical protein [Yersinia similis]CNH79379.1 Uncharacterised protein [Yersinia similis]